MTPDGVYTAVTTVVTILQFVVLSVVTALLVVIPYKLAQTQKRATRIEGDYKRLHAATSKALTAINSNGAFFEDMPDAEGKTRAWRELELWWENEQARDGRGR